MLLIFKFSIDKFIVLIILSSIVNLQEDNIIKNISNSLYFNDNIRKIHITHIIYQNEIDSIIQIDSSSLFAITYERDAALLDKSKMEVKYKVFLKISFWLFLILLLALLYGSRKKLY